MTVVNIPPIITYLENGVTASFAVPFQFLEGAHLEVRRIDAAGVETLASLGGDYLVTGGDGGDGTVIVTAPKPVGWRIEIKRNTPRIQPMDYTPGDAFPAESHERALDRDMMIEQEQDLAHADLFARALKLPKGENAGVLKGVADRVGGAKILAPDPVTGRIDVVDIDPLYRGPAGPANSTYASRIEMAANAPPGNLSAIVPGDGTFGWESGNFTALIAASPADFVASTISGFPASAGAWVRVPGDAGFATLAEIKRTPGVVGEVRLSSLYGGSTWIFRASVKVQKVAVTWDDELHQQANARTGGAGVWECQVGSMLGWLKTRVARNFALAGGRLDLASSLPSACTLVVHGDSLAYGQVNPDDPDRIIPSRIGAPTGFGDGSVHAWDQIVSPFPEVADFYLTQMFGDKIVTHNRGYSGDTISEGYARGRFAPQADYCLIEYGVNDLARSTENGGTDTVSQLGLVMPTTLGGPSTNNYYGDYTLEKFTEGYYKMLARHVIRGEAPICLTPYPYISLTGYDGTPYSAARLLMDFTIAIRQVAADFGAPIVSGADYISRYSLGETTHDGLHLNLFGHQVLGMGVAATIAGSAQPFRQKVGGPRILTSALMLENVRGVIPLANPINLPNINSFGRPLLSADQAADIIIDPGLAVHFIVHLECDELKVLPVGFFATGEDGGTKVVNVQVDFGLTGPRRPADISEIGLPNSLRVPRPPTTLAMTVTGPADVNTTRHVNHPGVFAALPSVMGRGTHVISISSPPEESGGRPFVLNALALGDWPDWTPMELLNGFKQFGDTQPAWTIADGILRMRGQIEHPDPDVGADVVFWTAPYSLVPPPVWVQLTATTSGALRSFNGNWYQAMNTGTTGTDSGAPVHTSGTVSDGGINWLYRGQCADRLGYLQNAWVNDFIARMTNIKIHWDAASLVWVDNAWSGGIYPGLSNLLNLGEIEIPLLRSAGE